MLPLFFPKICFGCKKILNSGERTICVICRHKLPLTHFHTTGNRAMLKVFDGQIPVKHATSLLYFEKAGLTQKLIHLLKYKKGLEIGVFFGKWLGAELSEISEYKTIEAVIPLPLHKRKFKKRGYNQVTGFGKAIAQALNISYQDEVLLKKSASGSQVFKNRVKRLFNPTEVFTCNNKHLIRDKHILIVDDIMTTGATLEASALQLLKVEGVCISFATMAFVA